VLTATLVGTSGIIGSALECWLRRQRPWIGVALGALALSPAFSLRELDRAGQRVEQALELGDLEAARHALRALVSRDTSALDASLLAAAGIESLAENLSDSVVAPLLFYAWLGLGGAYAYRAANTLDAMIGYRGSYEYLGKTAARLDDLLNLLPARLSGLLLVAACGPAGACARGAWRAMRADHAATPSPNAGWPMSAMAGGLGVCLEKVGHYRLGAELPTPRGSDLARARGLMRWAAMLGIATIVLASRLAGDR
jgi:adenosylcobinamide-phosphate synthase